MAKSGRYLALDVLRGITIAFMIIVNTPGSWQYIYAPLRHASWHGCTPTDLVFPFFLFVVGVSMFFSFSKYKNSFSKESLLKVGKRTLLIFAIGFFINSYPQWMTDYSQVRIMGVLQRIALAYGISALIVLGVKHKWLPGISGAILLFYWGILYFFGGADPYSLEGNITSAFDSAILGEQHLYGGFGKPFDPEGVLSTIPSVVTVLLGYLAGKMIKETNRDRVPMKLLLYGAVFTAAGYIWGLVFPINKALWTSSYVLYTGGLAAILFAILIFIIDLKGYKKWSSFFVVFGMNPLFIFALSGVWAKTLRLLIKIPDSKGDLISADTWLYETIFVPLAGNMNGSLLYAITHIIFFWLIGYILYKKRIFIKV
ncbi:heparan-alpha-glucosaminide N-acetyltransferase domain-containing protein [Marinilabiliaceae bacterium ANBcel2]|nr:heparan-alpha-glucosaminide N-acetyltransferase domain-containing protein [Marinilabiliaceae bacterium ANBcel2]